ncbi:tRNA-uridine aminocarboxypropyltransferase [Marinicellulosiphila megalodicopiae]|uniref:tRNA-uridine aminocarboxypropyltransferase n=1 Tax=Marinicellulosiphila megalodicopiae TaxID=2724896 RepID=UPI003BB00108
MSKFHDLYLYRKSLCTRPFKARGIKTIRCPICQIAEHHCICDLKQVDTSPISFCLLLHDIEILKPSNTGRLIADIFEDTHVFLYSRTNPDAKFLALLENSKYQPFIVFPKDYAMDNQIVYEPNIEQPLQMDSTKTPLLILLDGTWREAARMYRKTPKLHSLPMISIAPDILNETLIDYNNSNYILRQSEKPGHLATAEVAAKVINALGHKQSAQHLQHWFEVFCYRYRLTKRSIIKHEDLPVIEYKTFLKNKKSQSLKK